MSNYISVEDNWGLSQSQGSIEAVLLSETCPQEYFSNFWVMDFEDNMFIVEGSLIEELLSCEDESNTKGIIEFDWCNRFLDSLDSRRISGVIQSSTMIFQEEEVENFVRSAVLFQRRRAGKERWFKKRRLYTYVFSNFRRFVGDVFCFNWLSMLRTIDFRCWFLIDALFSLKLWRMLEKLRRLWTLRKYYKFVIKRSQLDQFPISEQYFFDVKMGLNDFVVHEIAKIRNPYNRWSFMNLDLGTTDFVVILLMLFASSILWFIPTGLCVCFWTGWSGLVYSTFNFFGDVNSFSTRLFWSSNVLKVLFANGTTCNVSYSWFDVGVSLMFGSPWLDFLKWVVHRVKHGKFNFLIRTASDIRCNLVENELYYDLFFNVFLFFSLLRHQVYINAADFFWRSYDNWFFFSNRFFGKQMIMSEPFWVIFIRIWVWWMLMLLWSQINLYEY